MAAVSRVLSVRVSESERALLEGAAEQERTTLSDFVRRRSVEAAELALLDDRLVRIPAVDWKKFEAWVQTPAKEVPALRTLASGRPIWQD